MASREINQDMLIEILSYTPLSIVQKFRSVNKECNERTYNSSFLKLNLRKTNSVSGYFLQYRERQSVHNAFFDEEGNGGSKFSLDFLPVLGEVVIEASDPSHGLLLCVNAHPLRLRRPDYIVCKPTTKQYMTIPKPKTRYFTIRLGLMVIRTTPLRFKILRLSELPAKEKMKYYDYNFTYVCEVFDSDSFVWKRLNNVEFPGDDSLVSRTSAPVAAYGLLHWLTYNNNVFRFCFKSDTCSFFPVPRELATDASLVLVKYGGKLCVINSCSKEGVNCHLVWVLESSLGYSWVKVKEFDSIGPDPVGFLCQDVVTLADRDRICLYNMNNGESKNLQLRAQNFYPYCFCSMSFFPFYSDYERAEFINRSGKCD